MSGIHIQWTELEAAFENHNPEASWFLDRESGEIVVTGDGRPDDAAQTQRVGAEPSRFLRIDAVPSRDQYRMMEDFIATVVHPALKERLTDSIVGKGAFRRFKDVLGRFPEERKRWFAFRDVLLHRHILGWLEQKKLQLAEMPAWSLELPTTPAETAETAPDDVDAPAPDATLPVERPERQELEELKSYLLAWARAHGEEYRYLFGPAAFERLSPDLAQEFTFFRRRSPP
jgi:hypothetical protein